MRCYTAVAVANFAVAVRIHTVTGIRCRSIVVARGRILTADNLVAITNTITVSILRGHTTVVIAYFAAAVCVDTVTGIRCRSIVVASLSVLTANNLVTVTNAIAVCVLNRYAAVAIACFAVAVCVYAVTCICGRSIVVTSISVLTADNLVTVTNTIAITVLSGYATIAIANLAFAVGIDTRSIFVRYVGIEVASTLVCATRCFVIIANTVSVLVLNKNAAIAVTCFTISICVETFSCISG